jgi:ESCRT-II complex subunit VPS22
MRRSIGISGIQKQSQQKQEFSKAGEQIVNRQLETWKNQLQIMTDYLQDFALKHKKEIKTDPAFRNHFQKMCSSIGVDPLASNKSYFGELLGMGDFYYELGIQVAEISIASRQRNGGFLQLDDLKESLQKMRKRATPEISVYYFFYPDDSEMIL